MTTEFVAEHYFDKNNCTQNINGVKIAFHCNHYTRLYTQLACDADDLFGGKQLLMDAAEEAFFKVLGDYAKAHTSVQTESDRAGVAKSYFSFSGLGMVEFDFETGNVVMPYSHVDEAWFNEWGENDKPINFIGKGYIAAAYSFVKGEAMGAYQVEEVVGIAQGARQSEFKVTAS